VNITQYENCRERKQHGSPDYPYTTYLCAIPRDFNRVPMHWHDDMEIVYIKKGFGRVKVNLNCFNVSAGSIILILPGQLHEILPDESNSTMEYENIIFNPAMLYTGQPDQCFDEYLHPLFSGMTAIPVHFSRDTEHYSEIAGIIDNCDAVRSRSTPGEPLYIKAQLFSLAFVLVNKCRLSEPVLRSFKAIDRMKTVTKYIELNYQEHISVKSMATLLSCSESHFMKCFRQNFGCTFVEYLKDYRLAMAARMLAMSDESVLNVSYECGFENISYFIRSFKAKYGVTPKEYSTMHR